MVWNSGIFTSTSFLRLEIPPLGLHSGNPKGVQCCAFAVASELLENFEGFLHWELGE